MTPIDRAISILRAGGLVAFPTETVYGLGADATSAAAVGRIFAAKGRPSTNPLIVHVADAQVARRYTTRWDDRAQRLAERFWPGPLTLVVPRAGGIVDGVTAGRDTVGLRAPDHPLALELLRGFDGPVAAPSANRSNRVSPTTAQHVMDELGDRVDLVLDGGACRVGIESTVLDLTSDVATILRPGAVTAGQISRIVGEVREFSGAVEASQAAASPGQHAIHYAPRARAYRFGRAERARVVEWCRSHGGRPWAVLYLGPPDLRMVFSDLQAMVIAEGAPRQHRLIQMPAGASDYARRLYATLRESDNAGVDVLFIEMPPEGPDWTAIRDRLSRATRPLPDELG